MTSLTSYFPAQVEKRKQKGRSQELLAYRDEKLATRFYFYAHIKGENYADTLNALVIEFDICERVVSDRLKANQKILDELFNRKPPITHLKRKIPYFTW